MVPGAALLMFLENRRVKFNTYMKLLTFMYAWIFICFPFSYNLDIASSRLHRLVGVYLLLYTVYKLAQNAKMHPYIYLIWILMYFACIYFTQTEVVTPDFDYTSDRASNEKLNANCLGYFTFFTTFIIFYWGEIIKKKYIRTIFKILFLLTILLSFYIAIITASRQVLIVQIPLITMLLYIRYVTHSGQTSMIIFLFIIFVVTIIAFCEGMDIYNNSYLSKRAEVNASEDLRAILLWDAIRVGIEHPIFGVGPGCFASYSHHFVFSHNTYTELFANCGFPAACLFISVIFVFIKRQWKQYKNTKDKLFLTFLVCGVIYALDNMFYVFHLDPWLMSFFVMISTHSEIHAADICFDQKK